MVPVCRGCKYESSIEGSLEGLALQSCDGLGGVSGAMNAVIGGRVIDCNDCGFILDKAEGGGVNGVSCLGIRQDDQVASSSVGNEGKDVLMLHVEGVRGNDGGV